MQVAQISATFTPQRFQRRRKKGSKLPPNTACVTRGTRWGNPFQPYTQVTIHKSEIGLIDATAGQITIDVRSREMSLAWYRIWAEQSVRLYQRHGEDWLGPLRGKHLACWCSIHWSCHADILLELLAKPSEFAQSTTRHKETKR